MCRAPVVWVVLIVRFLMSCWSKVYTGQVYQNPPPLVVDPTSRDLSREECQVIAQQMAGRPVCEEHQHTSAVGRVLKAYQDPHTGSLWADFQLRTDTPTFAKVSKGEMRGLSLGHEIEFTFPRRKVRPIELSVCKKGERANTMIVNASASQFFSAAAPRVLATKIMNPFDAYDIVPDEPTPPPQPALLPMKFVDSQGRSWLMKPKQIQASAAPATGQQFAMPQAPPPVQQAPAPANGFMSAQQRMASVMPYPFNEMMVTQPPMQPQQQQQVQQVQPMQVDNTAPNGSEGSRNKAAKRKAAEEAGDAEEAPVAKESAPSQKEEKKEEPATKKAATASTGATEKTPETPEELKAHAAAINSSNLPTALKTTLLEKLAENFEIHQKQAQEIRTRAQNNIQVVEQSMRVRGFDDAAVTAWKNAFKQLFENPLKHKDMADALEGAVVALGGGPSSSSLMSPSTTTMQTGMNPAEMALQRQMERVNQITGQTMTVLSSAATAPQQQQQQQQQPAFPVRSVGSLPILYEDGRQSVFVPRYQNPEVVLARNPNVQVQADPLGKGWIVNGRPQRQEFNVNAQITPE